MKVSCVPMEKQVGIVATAETLAVQIIIPSEDVDKFIENLKKAKIDSFIIRTGAA